RHQEIAILFLSEEADYDLPQARRAGIQRLLTRMGYDPGPIDGLDGPRTDAALRAFVADRNLPAFSVSKMSGAPARGRALPGAMT
ncbi:peptidoglycan-binding domain-containing protein, partial [Acinetobacter baumannii]|uniref:peptidoglycan-binding domain-containing protein n=1 Tax=Acinetobacter baumannii TaxID=470 RepID=UPI0013D3F4CA